MQQITVVSDPDVTVAVGGGMLLESLEARGASRSHIETTAGAAAPPRCKPKTIRNVLSSLHSVFELAIRRRLISENPCKRVDLPAVTQTEDIRYLTQPELRAVLERGVPDDAMGAVERPLYDLS
jgi:site-specific recombinase XerD